MNYNKGVLTKNIIIASSEMNPFKRYSKRAKKNESKYSGFGNDRKTYF